MLRLGAGWLTVQDRIGLFERLLHRGTALFHHPADWLREVVGQQVGDPHDAAAGVAVGEDLDWGAVVGEAAPDSRVRDAACGIVQVHDALVGGDLMTPGALMLGNPGQCYECGHEHGRGDRCVAFWYEPDYFERIA